MNRSTTISTDADTSRLRDVGSAQPSSLVETLQIAACVLGLVGLYAVLFLALTSGCTA